MSFKKKNNYKFSLLFFIVPLILIQISSFSQTRSFHTNGFWVEEYSQQDGFPGHSVTEFDQDNIGFMWMGTHQGLVRYDGEKFKLFKPDPLDSLNVWGNFVTGVKVDKEGLIWCSTFRGVYLFNPKQEIFKHLAYSPKRKGIPADVYGRFIIRSDKELWGLNRGGWTRFNKMDNGDIQINYMSNKYPDTLYQYVHRLRETSLKAELLKIKPDQKKTKSFELEEDGWGLILFMATANDIDYSLDTIWIEGSNTLFKFQSNYSVLAADGSLHRAQASINHFKKGIYKIHYKAGKYGFEKWGYDIPPDFPEYYGVQVFIINNQQKKELEDILNPEFYLTRANRKMVLAYKDEKIFFHNDNYLSEYLPDNGISYTGLQFSHQELIFNKQRNIKIKILEGHKILGFEFMNENQLLIAPEVTPHKQGSEFVLATLDIDKKQINSWNYFKNPLNVNYLEKWGEKGLFIGTWGQGLFYFNDYTTLTKTGIDLVPKPILIFPEEHIKKESAYVWSTYSDRKNNFWLGSFNLNLFKVQTDSVINSITLEEGVSFTSIITQEERGAWIGSKNHGIFYFNQENMTLSHSYLTAKIPKSLQVSNLQPLGLDSKKNLWIGGEDSIYIFNLKSQKIKVLPLNVKKPFLPFKIIEDKNGVIWIACKEGRILTVRPNIEEVNIFFEAPALMNFWVIPNMILDDSGHIWLGFTGSGLRKIEIKADPSGIIPPITKSYFDNGIIYDIQKIKGNYFWFLKGTTLFKWDINNEKVIDTLQFSWESPLKWLCSKDENFWLFSKTNQHWKFNYSTKESNKFSILNRLKINPLAKSEQFNIGENEQVFIVSENQFYSFLSDKVKKNQITPNVVFTEFTVANQPIRPDSNGILQNTITYTKKLRLNYNNNNIGISYQAIDFTDHGNVNYAYKMVGVNEDWVQVNKEKTARFANLPPGQYTFQVKAANADGNWHKIPTALQITILPPWWATWWAYCTYFLVIIAFINWIYHFQLNKRLAQAEAKRLLELDQVKNQLYTNISHEFRTPLTIISGVTDQVLTDPENWFRKGLNMIKNSSQDLLHLVNQMLELAKVQSGNLKLEMNQGDILEYIKYLLNSFHSFAESQGIELHLNTEDETIIMDYDDEKMKHILSNLLTNAIKFTKAGGNVYVSAKNVDQQLKLQVRDTGNGIPEEKIPYIFDRFYQVDNSSTRRGEGTGIGLALVKELVNVLDGKIEVTSQLEKGTEFTIWIPINRMASLRINPFTTIIIPGTANEILDSELTQSPSKKTDLPQLLIVEDNLGVIKYLSAILQEQYQLLIAQNGEEGIDIALKYIPDIIISDVMMPLKDGFEVLNTLKNDDRTSHIPIIMLTARTDANSRLEGLKRGADIYLPKPFNKKELLLQLTNLIELRKKLRERYSNGFLQLPQSTYETELDDKFIKNLNTLILENIHNPNLGRDLVVSELNMSQSQVYKKLKALTGLSLNIYIRSIRLEKAKDLLIATNHRIGEISFQIGINDSAFFSKIFSKKYGESPSKFRKNHKKEQDTHL